MGKSVLIQWNKVTNSGLLSQKVLNKIKPEAPLKNKIDIAQKRLQIQIFKLDSIHEKLQKKHDFVFNKIVDAQRSHNYSFAKAYALELNEIRKMRNMVGGSKLSMEQIQLRLNTVAELGDVIVTLSPCMSIIKGLGTSLSGIIPDANASMQDLSKMLGEMVSGSTVSNHDLLSHNENAGSDTMAILEEAQSIIEGQTKETIPEIPTTLKSEISTRSESLI